MKSGIATAGVRPSGALVALAFAWPLGALAGTAATPTISSAGDAIKAGDRMALKADAAIFHSLNGHANTIFCAPARSVFSIDSVGTSETNTKADPNGSNLQTSITKNSKTGATTTTVKGATSVAVEKTDTTLYLHIKTVGKTTAPDSPAQGGTTKSESGGSSGSGGFLGFFRQKQTPASGQKVCDGVVMTPAAQGNGGRGKSSQADQKGADTGVSAGNSSSADQGTAKNAAADSAPSAQGAGGEATPADAAVGATGNAADTSQYDLAVANNEYTTTVTELSHYGLYRQGFTYGALTIPYKYELRDHSFQAKPSVAAYVGYESWVAGATVAGVVALGLGGSSQSSSQSGSGAGSSQSSTTTGGGTQALYTLGVGALFTLGGSFKGGVLFGKDWAGAGTGFKYEGGTWMAVTLGVGF